MSAGLAIDSPRCEAWLIEWPDDPFLISPICKKHADTLSVPPGWLIHDERDGETSLFADRSVARAATTRATVAHLDERRARREAATEELTLFETPVHENPDDSGRNSASDDQTEQHNIGAEWIGDPDERHSDMLDVDATTPLLERAFRASQAS